MTSGLHTGQELSGAGRPPRRRGVQTRVAARLARVGRGRGSIPRLAGGGVVRGLGRASSHNKPMSCYGQGLYLQRRGPSCCAPAAPARHFLGQDEHRKLDAGVPARLAHARSVRPPCKAVASSSARASAATGARCVVLPHALVALVGRARSIHPSHNKSSACLSAPHAPAGRATAARRRA